MASATPELVPTFRLQWEETRNCFVLLYPEGEVELSGSAGEIMKRIDGSTDVDAIVADLERAFETQGLRGDIEKFLEAAHDNGWIRYQD